MIPDSSFGMCCRTFKAVVMYSWRVELSPKIDDLKLIERVSQKLLAIYSICDRTGATFTTKQSMRSSELRRN